MPANQKEFIDCRPDIQALRDEEDSGAPLLGVPKSAEVSRHRPDIV
jgi:hypothetical protein